MPRYTAWKTVINSVEKTHRSQNATDTYLIASALNLPDGVRIEMCVPQQHAGDRWYPYETLVVHDGRVGDV